MIDPQECFDAIGKWGPIHAEAKANRVYLEEYTKSLRAILMSKSGENSGTAREQWALAQSEYKQHIKAIQVAVQAEEAARWNLVQAQVGAELWRSMNAAMRAEGRAAR